MLRCGRFLMMSSVYTPAAPLSSAITIASTTPMKGVLSTSSELELSWDVVHPIVSRISAIHWMAESSFCMKIR